MNACWVMVVLAGSLGPPLPATVEPTLPSTDLPAITLTADRTLTLDLPTALAIGLERSRDLRLGRLDAVLARTDVTRAWAAIQPQLRLGGAYSAFDSTTQGISVGEAGATKSHSISFQVQQLVFDTAQSLYAIYRTRQTARAAELRELETELTVAGRIAEAFYATARAAALERLAGQLLDLAEQQRQQAAARLEQKLGARLDLSRAEVARRNAEVERQAAASATREALARLRYELVLPPGLTLELDDAYAVPGLEWDLDEALRTALAEQPAIGAAEATARARRHALTAASLSRWVSLTVTASYEYFLESSRDKQSEYVLSAALRLPLWDGQAGEATETAARANWERATQQQRQAIEQAQLAIEQNWLAWRDATERLAAAEAAVALARETVDQTAESHRLGVASQLELTDARTEYARAEANRIQARVARDLAAVQVRVAAGQYPLGMRDGEVAGE